MFLIITILLEQICVKRGGDGDIMKINIWFRICSTVNMSKWWGCMPPHREWAFLEFKICDKCEDFCIKCGNHAVFEFRWTSKKTPFRLFCLNLLSLWHTYSQHGYTIMCRLFSLASRKICFTGCRAAAVKIRIIRWLQLHFIQCPFPNQIQFGLEKLHQTSQELRMLSRSLSDCRSLLLNLNLNLNRCLCLCLCSGCSGCSGC